jgi:hypothetical protein
MQAYYGTKLVYAKAMTRGEYNNYRGWEPPEDEDQSTLGVLVEYTEPGTKPNHLLHEGYISWSPLEVFSSSYQPLTALSFGHAIEALESGKRVMREGWNGKGMWVILIGATAPESDYADIDYIIRDDTDAQFLAGIRLQSWYGLKTADGGFVPWQPSQTDMRAKDWQVVDDDE